MAILQDLALHSTVSRFTHFRDTLYTRKTCSVRVSGLCLSSSQRHHWRTWLQLLSWHYQCPARGPACQPATAQTWWCTSRHPLGRTKSVPWWSDCRSRKTSCKLKNRVCQCSTPVLDGNKAAHITWPLHPRTQHHLTGSSLYQHKVRQQVLNDMRHTELAFTLKELKRRQLNIPP